MLTINSKQITTELPDQTSLLSFLQGELGLSSPKLGCGEGACGACKVLVDGEPQTSCNLSIWAAQGCEVVTLEHFSEGGQPSALQQAFIDENAGQCGYCLSGILISASALLKKNPNPSRAQICEALDQHLCRCGAHERIIRAVLRASEQAKQKAKSQ